MGDAANANWDAFKHMKKMQEENKKKEQNKRLHEEKQMQDISDAVKGYERKENEKKLSAANLEYIAALNAMGRVNPWIDREFRPGEKEELQKSGSHLGDIEVGNPSEKVKEGIYTQNGDPKATKSVVYEVNERGEGKLYPHGEEWTTGFDKNGWSEVFDFAQQKLGADTINFDFQNIGEVTKNPIWGNRTKDATRRLAIEQLTGILALGMEKGVEVKLGPKARELLRQMANDDDLKHTEGGILKKMADDLKQLFGAHVVREFKFKNEEGDNVHYRHKIEEMENATKNNRDYQNMKMGLRDANIKNYKDNLTPEPEFDKDGYLKNITNKRDKDGELTDEAETNDKLLAEAAEKEIDDLEDRVDSNNDPINALNDVIDKQSRLISQAKDSKVLDKINEIQNNGNGARLDRDELVDKLEKRNKNTLSRVEAVREKLTNDNARLNNQLRDVRDENPSKEIKEKQDALLKNKKSLDKLDKIESNIKAQDNDLKNGIKAWDRGGKRNDTVKAQKQTARIERDEREQVEIKIKNK